MKKLLLNILKFFGSILPQTVPELIYTSLPRFIKKPVNALLSSSIPEYVKVGNVDVALNKQDPVVSGALMLGVYEKHELKLLQEKLKPGMNVIDLGANVGLYTALAASIVGNTGKVFAFEPDKDNFIFLQKTVTKNNFSNIECNQIAISDHGGEGKLYFSEDNFGDHRIFDSHDNRKSYPIQLMTLDSFVSSRNIQKVDFIKMDIQGAEGFAMKGMEGVLKHNPQLQIFTEFWPQGIAATGESPLAFLEILKKYQFDIFEINRTTGHLSLVTDINALTNKLHGREFANLYCKK